MNLLVEDAEKARQNRERVASERDNKPYYWWEYPDPFQKTPATPRPVSSSTGLARSRQELKIRTRRG